MSSSEVVLLALLIGVVAGLRSMTAPAAVAWGANQLYFNINATPLFFMGSLTTVIVFAVLAVAELVADKLPFTPRRTGPRGMITRIVLGGLSGGGVALGGGQSLWLGALLGVAGGIGGAFGGYQARTRLVKALRVPDFVIAVMEDAVAIGGGLFIVSRF